MLMNVRKNLVLQLVFVPILLDLFNVNVKMVILETDLPALVIKTSFHHWDQIYVPFLVIKIKYSYNPISNKNISSTKLTFIFLNFQTTMNVCENLATRMQNVTTRPGHFHALVTQVIPGMVLPAKVRMAQFYLKIDVKIYTRMWLL